MKSENRVVQAVVNYFDEPQFGSFYSKCEHAIQFGSKKGFADVVLIANKDRLDTDDKGKRRRVPLATIVECKKEGFIGDGRDQLRSYLNASGSRYGIFANTEAGPSQWDFYENLGSDDILPITQNQFETELLREDNLTQANVQSGRADIEKYFVNTGANMKKIRPTLYVGLGTTGVDILTKLRELNCDEYGQAGLPIFRYISIETDENTTGKSTIDDANYMSGAYENGVPKVKKALPPRSYAENKVIYTSIPHTQPIRERINPDNTEIYDKHLAAWLDERILNSESVKLAGAGAGNLRMAGRLSLWENWNETVMPELTQAYRAFQHPDHKDEAKGLLNSHFGRTIGVDNQKHSVFIVGTLCGGTCSGMLLDIAYYFQHIGNADTRIYGVFTMYNQELALGGDSAILLANCYASLVELDYYKRANNWFRVGFPNGSDIDTQEAPFHVATFLGATNMENWNCTDRSGLFDRTQLNKMAATDLFVRSLGIDALIEADLANVPKRDNQFGRVRDSGGFVQYMFSSGVEIVGAHKNLNIDSAVGDFINILRQRWRASPPLPGVPDPKTLVPSGILDDIKHELRETGDGVDLLTDLLKQDIESIPEGDAVEGAKYCLHKFTSNGKYGDTFKQNSDRYRNQFREELRENVDKFNGDCQLYPKQRFLSGVQRLISEKKGALNADIPDVTGAVDDAEAAATGDPVKKRIFGKSETELDVNQFKREITEKQSEFRNRLTDSFASKTLNGIESDIETLRQEVDREIGTIEQKFTDSIRVSENSSSYKKASYDLSRRVFDNEFNSPEKVERLILLLHKADPEAFRWAVKEILKRSFNDVAPHLIRSPDFSFGEDAHRRSGPYQEFTSSYDNYRLKFEQQGGTNRLFRYLFAQDDDKDLRKKTKAIMSASAVPNLRVLYLMEAGYALNDVLVAKALKKAYDDAQDRYRNGDEDPVHIDKDSEKFDQETIEKNERFNQRLEEVQQHWRVCRELICPIRERDPRCLEHIVPTGNLSENGSIGINGNGTLRVDVLAAKVVGTNGITETFYDNEQGWKKLAEASPNSMDSVAFGNFREQTLQAFGRICGSHTDPKSLEYLIDALHKMKAGSELEESENFYKNYLALF